GHVKVLLGMFLSLKTLYRKRTVIWPFYFYTIIRTLSKSTTIDIDTWHIQKNIRKNLTDYSILEIGFSTFFLNRTNRSGIIDKAGPIGGFKQNGNYLIDCRFNKESLIKKIVQISNLKENIEVYNMDALEFIDKVLMKRRSVFTFFDPPYYKKGSGLYTNYYLHEDHHNLANYIQRKLKNRKWIITYDKCDEIKKMYDNLVFKEINLNYSLQNKKTAIEYMFYSKAIKSKGAIYGNYSKY
ncbi:hypothetical protein, partial [Staphylococcus aureus]|uniref:hypothetical protein n=1 Tax=Staphylococcus aureus TaxID=1280 RepID=UPI001F055998